MTLTLEGMTVVDLSQGVSGPLCTRALGHMGARVIKVERPGMGDIVRHWDDIVNGMCSGHAWVNPNKESLALNLKSKSGRDIFFQLVKKADVVIENFVPGHVEGWGITYETLKEVNPKVIYCQISGFGQEGPYRNRTALDLIIQGEAGIIPTNGVPEQPSKVSLSVCDLSGYMYALTSILEALFHRERFGVGQKIDVSLLDTVMSWLGYFPYLWWYRERVPERVGFKHHTMTPYGPYRAKDGKYVIVAAGSGALELWRRFCTALGVSELAEDPRYLTNELRMECRTELDQIMEGIFGREDRDYWIDRLHAFDIPCGALRELNEALEHPQIQFSGLIKEVQSAMGPIKVIDYPVKMSESDKVLKMGPPLVGEHTRGILRELGYSEGNINDLRLQGVVDWQETSEKTM